MVNWELIRKRIWQELKRFRIEDPEIFSKDNIILLQKLIVFNIDSPELQLDGVENRLPNAFHRILVDGISKDDTLSFFPDFAKIEPFFKKLLFLIDQQSFRTLNTQKKGLAHFINHLGLNPLNIYVGTAQIEDHIGGPNFIEHLIRIYKLRNTESHACEDWPSKELFENVESILVVYLFAINEHKDVILELVNPIPNVNSYLTDVVDNFEKWQSRFVHIMGKEKFEEIDLYALESDEWIGIQDEEIPLREGRIDDLRNSIVENRMVILGEPGMGKSTTLQYLAYRDAKQIIQNSDTTTKIPVFIELKLISKDDNIFNVICKKLKLTKNDTRSLLENEKLSIFLDGLNEVIKDIRKQIRVDILNFMTSFSKLSILITSRPLAYSNEFDGMPVFVLQKLDSAQIQEFLVKNCQLPNIRRVINMEIDANPKFAKIIRVPLMLRMLINVAISSNGQIPPNKVLIIKRFIDGLYKRENEKVSMDFDYRIIHRLLCYLGFKSRELKGSNAGMRIEEIDAVLERRIEQSRFKINVYEFVDIAKDLNILVEDQNKLSFIHELYQEYYASEEIFRIRVKQNT